MSDNENARRSINKQNALQLVEAGFAVFPSDGKIPLVKSYNKLDIDIPLEAKKEIEERVEADTGEKPVHVGCTRTKAAVTKMWRKYPDAVPSIACGPSGLVVLDADVKHNGPVLLGSLYDEHGGLPEYVVRIPTRSGGHHDYYADPEAKQTNRAGALKKLGTDVRGSGGQVIAPGSIRQDGKRYGDQNDLKRLLRAKMLGTLKPLPEFMIEKIGQSAGPDETDNPEVAESKQREIINTIREEDWPEFENVFDPTIGYDLAALKAKDTEFAKLYDEPTEDCSTNRFAAARAIMREWPKLTPVELAVFFETWPGSGELVDGQKPGSGQYDARQIAREWLKNQNLQKITDGSAFGVVDENEDGDAPIEQKVIKIGFTWGLSLAENYKPVRWFVKGFVPLRSVGAIYGAPNVGKSFIAFDMANHGRRGLVWFGRKTKARSVLYLNGEGSEGIASRMRAWADHHDTSGGDIAVADGCPNFFADPKCVKKTVKLAREVEAATGEPIGLLVIDTLSVATAGADENSTQDMMVVCNRLRQIAQELDCAVLIVHHSGKDAKSGLRGASAINGAIDFALFAEEGKAGRPSVLSNPKQRDGARSKSINYRLKIVKIGTDEDGEDVTSCIVFPELACDSVDLNVGEEAPETDDQLTIEQARADNEKRITKLTKWLDLMRKHGVVDATGTVRISFPKFTSLVPELVEMKLKDRAHFTTNFRDAFMLGDTETYIPAGAVKLIEPRTRGAGCALIFEPEKL